MKSLLDLETFLRIQMHYIPLYIKEASQLFSNQVCLNKILSF